MGVIIMDMILVRVKSLKSAIIIEMMLIFRVQSSK